MMTLSEFKRRFETEVRITKDFFLAKHRTAWMRDQCLLALESRNEVLDNIEEKIARSILGPDFCTPQDGS